MITNAFAALIFGLEPYEFFVQALGIVAMCVCFISFQFNSRRGILLMQVVSCLLFGIHFFMLGNMTAALLNFINIPRNLIFYVSGEKKWRSASFFVVAFLVIYAAVGVITWDKWYSFLPVIGMLSSTASFFSQSPTVIRICQLICSPCWLINNILSGSMGGALAEIFNLISVTVAVIRYDIIAKRRARGSEES